MSKEKQTPKKSLKIKISNPFKNINLKKIKVQKPDVKKLRENKVVRVATIVLVVIVSLGLIDLLVQYLNNSYSIAVVDGVRIPRSEYYDRLETAYGQATAQQLIDEEVTRLEAKKAGVTVTDDEVNTRLQDIIDSVGGQDAYEKALVSSNITEDQLKDQIQVDELTNKILAPQVTYTDADLKEFFDQYSSVIFPDETAALEDGAKLDFDTYKSQVADIYVQQQVQTLKSSWLDSKIADYKIQDNSTNEPKYGVFTTTINIVKNLISEVNSKAQN